MIYRERVVPIPNDQSSPNNFLWLWVPAPVRNCALGRDDTEGVARLSVYPFFPTRYPAAGCGAPSLARPSPNSFSRNVPFAYSGL